MKFKENASMIMHTSSQSLQLFDFYKPNHSQASSGGLVLLEGYNKNLVCSCFPSSYLAISSFKMTSDLIFWGCVDA